METMRSVAREGSAVRLDHSQMAFSDVKLPVVESFPFPSTHSLTRPRTYFTTRTNLKQTATDYNYLY